MKAMEKELTKVELQLMNILWDEKEAFVSDILDILPEPKPAYNTISTFMRILVTKGFVGYKAIGKGHKYYPLIDRESYMDFYLMGVKNTFFKGSFQSMISFFAQKEKLSKKELEELIQLLDNNKQIP
jgi:BlaI family transcriptional regulator, penicillinase repressor